MCSGDQPTSLLIANLAIADLLVGVVVMPLAVSNIVTQSKWFYGGVVCKLWISLDVICCTASILTLCAISGDRFVGVTRPLQYPSLVTKRRVLFFCSAIWVVSLAILLSAVRWNIDVSDECGVSNQLQYVVQSTVGSFFIPLAIICFLYYKIFQVVNKRERSLLLRLSNVFAPQNENNEQRIGLFIPLRVHYGRAAAEREEGQNKAFNKQKKAAKTLGIVVGAFISCWTPFFILHSLNAITNNAVVPGFVMDFFTWLGYFNSTLNPFIYGMTTRSFKRRFRDFTCPYICSSSLFRSKRNRQRSERSGEGMDTSRKQCTQTDSFSGSQVSVSKKYCATDKLQRDHSSANCNNKSQYSAFEICQNDFSLKLYRLLISSKATDL